MSDIDLIYPAKVKKARIKGKKVSPTLPKRVSPTPKRRQTKRGRGVERKKERKLVRKLVHHTFDVYEDQLNRLRGLKLKAQKAGKKTPISEFLREALDSYLERKKELSKEVKK